MLHTVYYVLKIDEELFDDLISLYGEVWESNRDPLYMLNKERGDKLYMLRTQGDMKVYLRKINHEKHRALRIEFMININRILSPKDELSAVKPASINYERWIGSGELHKLISHHLEQVHWSLICRQSELFYLEDTWIHFDDISDECSLQLTKDNKRYIDMKLRRLDACIDVIVNPNIDYIQLFRKGDYCHENVKYYPNGKSFYIVNKQMNINFYYKEHDPKLRNLTAIEEDYIQNMIRFEVQLKGEGIKNRRAGTRRFGDYEMMDDAVTEDIVLKQYKKIVGFEDFYSEKVASRMIMNSNERASTSIEMINVIKLITTKRTIGRAREHYSNRQRFNSLLRRIRNLGINPITIPRSWKMARVDNPIKHYFTQE